MPTLSITIEIPARAVCPRSVADGTRREERIMSNAINPEETYESGLKLIERGLAPFLLSRDDSEGKIPLRNCAGCFAGSCGGPPCECLTCHGFYAATLDPQRWLKLVKAAPAGYLAISTHASGVLVVDIEAEGMVSTLREGGVMALPTLPPTLAAATPGGGRHLFYEVPGDEQVISRNRVVPYVDIKAHGGYVAAPGGRRRERIWLDHRALVIPAPEGLLSFLRS